MPTSMSTSIGPLDEATQQTIASFFSEAKLSPPDSSKFDLMDFRPKDVSRAISTQEQLKSSNLLHNNPPPELCFTSSKCDSRRMSCAQLHEIGFSSKVDDCNSVGGSGSTTARSMVSQQRLHYDRISGLFVNESEDCLPPVPDTNNVVDFLINRQHVSASQADQPRGVYTPQVKIDSLYKPILRRFRSHFRSLFDVNHNKKLY